MCCDAPSEIALPVPVAEMLRAYRDRMAADGVWGDASTALMARVHRYAPFLPPEKGMELLGRCAMAAGADLESTGVEEAFFRTPAFAAQLRDVIGDGRLAGLVRVRLVEGGVEHDAGEGRLVLEGSRSVVHVLVDSGVDDEAAVTVGGRAVQVAAGSAALFEVETDGDVAVVVDGTPSRVPALAPVPSARLRLRAGMTARWSVVDAAGGAWFPEGALRKWDSFGRPFFHGDDVDLEVPAGAPLQLRVGRGLEYAVSERTVELGAGETRTEELAPERRLDLAARGWYGGDLHVHMNYGGAQVCRPEDAAAMQHGEALHVLSLTAANCLTDLIYDGELLEATAGADLPWSCPHAVARAGVEYRNDLLGHLHATAPARPPTRYSTGHAASGHTEDWPPNAVACAELKELGATVGYCHPVMQGAAGDDELPDRVLAGARTLEARELVADAALGLVDSLDVLSNGDFAGAAILYRRLLGAGIPLAVTAGTDSLLSFSRFGTYSNPPGWARVYARLDGPLTMENFRDAVRAGRTTGTNGPWLELEVDGRGPGERLALRRGDRVAVRVRAVSAVPARLVVRGAGGVIAEAVVDGEGEVATEVVVDEPGFVVASLEGPADPAGLDQRGSYAHTSAVYLDVDGVPVARAADAAWCLRWLDLFEDLVRREGRFDSQEHLQDVLDLVDRARDVYGRVADPGGGKAGRGGGAVSSR